MNANNEYSFDCFRLIITQYSPNFSGPSPPMFKAPYLNFSAHSKVLLKIFLSFLWFFNCKSIAVSYDIPIFLLPFNSSIRSFVTSYRFLYTPSIKKLINTPCLIFIEIVGLSLIKSIKFLNISKLF